jgi:hypothetical protein
LQLFHKKRLWLRNNRAREFVTIVALLQFRRSPPLFFDGCSHDACWLVMQSSARFDLVWLLR